MPAVTLNICLGNSTHGAISHGTASASLHNLRGAQSGPLASKGPQSPGAPGPEPEATERAVRAHSGVSGSLHHPAYRSLPPGELRQTAWSRLVLRRHLCQRDALARGHSISLTQAAVFREPGDSLAQLKMTGGQPCTQHLGESRRRRTVPGVLGPAFLKGPLTHTQENTKGPWPLPSGKRWSSLSAHQCLTATTEMTTGAKAATGRHAASGSSRVPQGDPPNNPVRWGPGSLVYR